MNPRALRWSPAIILVIAGSTQSLVAGPFGATIELSSLNGDGGFRCLGLPAYSSGRTVSVSGAGDINGDGIDDFIIGASYAEPNGFYSGASYVVFGGAGIRFVRLGTLNGANGFICKGINAFDFSGRSVSGAGDLNGDGIDDLIIGADFAPNGSGSGQSYVVFGGAGVGASGSLELSTLNGANGYTINGIDAGDLSGRSVSGAGDVNGDGIDDLIIGASNADPNGASSGESYVVFGGAGVGASGTFNLSTLNGVNGYVINGIDAGDKSGRSVSGAGDVNGDGIDDLIIGAYLASPNGSNSGESYVVFGGAAVGASGTLDLSTLNGANGYIINGIDVGDNCGISVSGAGDVNGDGIGDLIIGANFASPNGANSGESYVVFGGAGVGAGGTLNLSTLNGANGFVCNGIDPDDWSGRSVSSAGDVNGDGIGDLIIGAHRADPGARNSAGQSYLIFGGVGIGAGGTLELSALNGVNGLVINGIDANDHSGISVSGVGDVNGDGVEDLIIGASPSSSALPYSYAAGESYVVFGRAAPPVDLPADLNDDCVVDVADLAGLIGAFGSAGPFADINGDGVVDTADLGILLGAFGTMCP